MPRHQSLILIGTNWRLMGQSEILAEQKMAATVINTFVYYYDTTVLPS
jgi:hypothetical protein